MKHFNLLGMTLLAAFQLNAQETTVTLSMEQNYSKDVFFKFENGHTESFDKNSWDIAFLRTGSFEFGERVNDGLSISVFEASNNPADYASIDPANIDNWPQLYNSDTTWNFGPFDQASADYGWGEYNPATHHVTGKIVFVLQYGNGAIKKFMIEDFFGGYTIKYADWNASTSTWGEDHSAVIPNSQNQGKLFNYFNLNTHQDVIASPDLANWDLVFQSYLTDLGIMYPVIGALQNPNVTVAKSTDENAGMDDLTFAEEINTVGYDWKSFNGSGYTVNSDMYYFLKYNNGDVYRFHFLTYEGSSTGNFSLAYENVTEQMDVVNFDSNNSLSIYPNPSKGDKVNLLYESSTVGNVQIEVYDMSGKTLIQKQLPSNGYFKHELNLNNLAKGIYILKFTSGKYSTTKKLLVN